MSKKKSRMSTKGGSMIGWDNIEKFSFGRHIRMRSSYKSLCRRLDENEMAHNLDRMRQEYEAGTNWDFVRLLLDANKGLSLEDAKRIAGTIGAK